MKIHVNPVTAIACDEGVADFKAGTIPSGDTRRAVLSDYVWASGQVRLYILTERSLTYEDSMVPVTFNCITSEQPTRSHTDPYSRIRSG